jgi:hypothetical protein
MLYRPDEHEPLAGGAWDGERVRAGIEQIADETEAAFDPESLWPVHPRDVDPGDPPRWKGVYLGAAGVLWALDTLGRPALAGAAPAAHEAYLAEPDLPQAGVVPGLWMGEAGILVVCHKLAPDERRATRLLDCVRANAENETWELMWGSPGTMLAARALLGWTGDRRWEDAWRDSAERLWARWEESGLWTQHLYGRVRQLLGPAHGFAGNVLALAQGGERLDEIRARVATALERTVLREEELANWPPYPGSRPGEIRVQWCHGAPGIVASLGALMPEELARAGAELTWRAGPLAKGPGLCHGTAGNGYALLRLYALSGDDLWLERARAFAMHALAQVERERAAHGRGRFTLWTGDLGVALYLRSCLDGTAEVPTIDAW